ncbi:hypothetical protein [Streptomyces californicus]
MDELEKYPPIGVTRPWGSKGGGLATVQLIVKIREKAANQSNGFNS